MATLVEYSKSSSALCRNPQCGHSSRNILKGTIRFKVPELGFTHLECLPSGCNIAARNLEGLSTLKQEDRHLVEALLKIPTNQTSPAKAGSQQKPFLTLLQNVLDTVTKATNVVSTQGEQTACEVLLQDLQHICQGHHIPHRFGSPIAQVSLDGSTPHTVSTLSSHNTVPQSALSSHSGQSVSSAYSVSNHFTSTPSQEFPCSVALLGTESASAQKLDQDRRHNVQDDGCSISTQYMPEQIQHALSPIPEEAVLSDPAPSAVPPFAASAKIADATAEAMLDLQVSASAASHPVPVTSAQSDQRSVSSTSSGQRKHARVIEAATAPPSSVPRTKAQHSTVPHPAHRNKHSKGYVALQAHLKTHLLAQQYLQEHPPTVKDPDYDPVYSLPPGTSRSHSSTTGSGGGTGVLARLAPHSRGTGSASTRTSVSAIGLGSPVPTRKQELLTELSQQYQSVIAAGATLVAGAGASGTSTSTTSMRSTSASSAPGSHSTLRLLLRAENEQRRKTLPQALPRFRSATSTHLAQLEQQQQQQRDR